MGRGRSSTPNLEQAIELSGGLVGLMVVITIVNTFSPFDLRLLGIVPRTWHGLIGIIFAPMLHLGFDHLLANAAPLFVLLLLLFTERKYDAEWTLICIWVGSGLGTWLFGRGGAVHIGASSLIYGVVVYLVASAWWLRQWRPIVVSLVVLVLYGGIFYGMLPHRGTISWEGHLAGAIAGFLTARHNHG